MVKWKNKVLKIFLFLFCFFSIKMILNVRNCVLRAKRCKRALNGSYYKRCFDITSSICYLFYTDNNKYIPDYSNMVGEPLAYVQSLGLKAKRVISCSMIVQLSDHLKRVVFLWLILRRVDDESNICFSCFLYNKVYFFKF